MRFSIFSTVLASLALLHGILAAKIHVVHAGAKAHAGREIAKRNENTHLAKRFSNARFSFYDAGLGACGKVNKGSDFIVAINHYQFDGGSHCFDTITISYGGKTATAQIVDLCVGCPPNALDFSRGLFNFFGPESAGYLYGSWTFGAGEPEPKPTPKPTPTSTWKPKTTSTSTKHTTSTTSTSTTSTSTSSSTTSTSAPAVQTPAGVLSDANQALLAFAALSIGAGAADA